LDTTELAVDTSGAHVIDLTDSVTAFCRSRHDGLVHVFVPHATAGVALMETGSGSEADLERLMADLVPRDDRWAHRHGARGHGADHLLPVLVSPSLSVTVGISLRISSRSSRDLAVCPLAHVARLPTTIEGAESGGATSRATTGSAAARAFTWASVE